MKERSTERQSTAERIADEGDIRSYTREEIERLIADGGDLTDWARFDAMTEEEIEANALSDPDDPHLTAEEMATGWTIVYPPSKDPISIRLDADILEFLKRDGPGYQSRINGILRAYMEAKQAAATR